MNGTVTLKHGGDVPESAVRAIMLSLDLLLEQEPIAFYELVQVCRDETYELFGNTGGKLISRALLEGNGQPHDIVRAVVLSAVSGEGYGLIFGSPYADSAA